MRKKKVIHAILVILLVSMFYAPLVLADETEKPSLVALGDSITAGFNLADPEREAFPFLIGGGQLDVTNLGVPGWTTSDLLDALQIDEAFIQVIQDSDVITINIGSNDLLQAARFAEIMANPTLFDPAQMNDDVLAASGLLSSNLIDIITLIRTNSSSPIVLYNIYNPIVAGDDMFSATLFQAADAIIKSVNEHIISSFNSTEYGIVVVDAFVAFDGNQEIYMLPNDVHPNIVGQQILAGLANALLATILPPPEEPTEEDPPIDEEPPEEPIIEEPPIEEDPPEEEQPSENTEEELPVFEEEEIEEEKSNEEDQTHTEDDEKKEEKEKEIKSEQQTSTNSEDDKHKLPNTASALYTYLAIGLSVLMLGFLLLVFSKQQLKKLN
ncbi:GDSL-type esterase/lipase family protein [Evansella sp. AB-P1]|uniref:SGNH/GDSL hydrolase family protein n=1 Tax=Evansella sp. AB-P1 TaxID=3037653 RepID=UPI00241D1511|nr:GDSL-type esterase/lipase family protein [Evansella sp. AB-P1]MDG5789824.1 GDSL-type esterase/lipase family protein [Evansella sp. AB-P1]